MAARGTRATQELTKLRIQHQVHAYTAGSGSESYGLHAAAELGVSPDRLFKTLVASVDDRLAVGVVPVSGSLDLKALAAALGGKRAEMAEAAVAERATGYVVGGISPIGQRRKLPVVIDATALDHQTVFCSAGQRGLQLELAPQDLIAATSAVVAPIGRPGTH